MAAPVDLRAAVLLTEVPVLKRPACGIMSVIGARLWICESRPWVSVAILVDCDEK
jgi:hypothetical protein